MSHPFDIFLIETGGTVLWQESTATMEAARERVCELAKTAPGEYIIMNQETGQKFSLKPAAIEGAPDWYNVRYPSWEKLYLEARQEEDPEQLFPKVIAAETAIVERLLELGKSPDENYPEKKAISDASDALLSIKTGKLNFPGWKLSHQHSS